MRLRNAAASVVVLACLMASGTAFSGSVPERSSGHVRITVDGHSLASLNHRFGDDPHGLFSAQDRFAEHYRATHDNALPHTLFWAWLTARHDLDPARFDHWHPMVGRWIEQSRHQAHCGHRGVSCSPVTYVPSCCPGAVPEPAGWLLVAVGMIGVVVTVSIRKKITKKGV